MTKDLRSSNANKATNPNVDLGVVAAYDRLVRELKALGVEVHSGFGLEPPLGRDRADAYGENGQLRRVADTSRIDVRYRKT